jgi:hypothetical protein
MSPRIRLLLAAALFLGWIAYLGFAALTKSRAPLLSRVQAASADAAVVARWDGHGTRATVTRHLWGIPLEGEIDVQNLPKARGFTTPGEYLLYVVSRHGTWEVVGPQRSPGMEPIGSGSPLIYPWTEDVQKQEGRLRPPPP